MSDTSNRIRIMTVVGTRPEIIRLSRVIVKLTQYTDHVLVHTGQNYDYELSQVFFDGLGLPKPDFFLDAAGGSALSTISCILARIEPVLKEQRPDAMLVLGDTNSCLAALGAKKFRVPLFHMEAGNRCFDLRVPEETNRKIVDHIADINMPYSQIAREYLLREGIPADRVVTTGSPMAEVIEHNRSSMLQSQVLESLGLKPHEYFVVSMHREENVESDERVASFIRLLQALRGYRGGRRVIVSTHPRTRKRLQALGTTGQEGIEFHKPFGYADYLRLQTEALAVLSDSGTITEEASILNFPALNLREAHERPEGMEEAAVVMVGLNVERALQALAVVVDQPRGPDRLLSPVRDYDVPNVSDKVLRIILSYVDYVKRKNWMNES